MGILINKSDFVGEYDLVKSNSDNINAYIAKYEPKILRELMGSDLLALFQANLNNQIPTDPIYLDLYNPFVKEVNGCVLESEGIKTMVLGMVYFFLSRKAKIKASMNGPVENQTEVSQPANTTFLPLSYNESVNTYRAIQQFCYANKAAVYPTFIGVHKGYASLF